VVSEGGATTVTDSQINGNNVSTDDGDAGAILALSELQVAGTLVAGNTVTSGEDAAAVFATGGLTIEDLTIRDNGRRGAASALQGPHAGRLDGQRRRQHLPGTAAPAAAVPGGPARAVAGQPSFTG
jgi:hypothetical protein